MIIKTLNRSEAQNAMKEWVLNYPSLPEVEGDYLKIRKDIQEFNQKVRSECPDSIAKKDYYIDAHIGILLYDYLWRVPGFNLRAAANDDFWRYLSIKVIPDVVAERWGYDNESHYWSKPQEYGLDQFGGCTFVVAGRYADNCQSIGDSMFYNRQYIEFRGKNRT